MQTTITQVSTVEYNLEIRATADDLAADIRKVLREQRARTNLKGFRQGKVPISVVKKLYGKALAYGVAEKSIQESYEAEVMEKEEHEVLGRPKITELEYELDGDLFAVVRFGVRPTIELADLEGETISKLVHEISEADVDEQIDRLREQHAVLSESTDPVGDTDFVVVDLQEMDEHGLPVVGRREEGITFHLADKRVKAPLREGVVGKLVGDVVTVRMPHDEGTEESGAGTDAVDGHDYQVVIREVKTQDLPDFDDELVKKITEGKVESADAYRDEFNKQLVESWEARSRELLEGMIVERLLEINEVEVPESVVDLYLDSFVEDVRRRGEGELPESFDEQKFREEGVEEATRQSKWMLIRDQLIRDHGFEVTDESRLAYFGKMSGDGDVDPEMFMKYYQSMPGVMDRLDQRLLSEKVFDHLIAQFELIEKTREEFEDERKQKLEAKLKAEQDDLSDDGDSRSSWWTRPLQRVWNQWRKPR